MPRKPVSPRKKAARQARPPDAKAKITVLEERVAWLQHQLDELGSHVAAQDKRQMDLQSLVDRLVVALRAARQEDGGPLLGANPEEDPVPRSG
jgi:uncharacterized coiled-coil protein SlyX